MAAKKNDPRSLIQEIIANSRDDRDRADKLLEDLGGIIGKAESNHREYGMIAVKYLESLQKSNEQLVRIVDLLRKDTESLYSELDDSDVEDIYSELEDKSEE